MKKFFKIIKGSARSAIATVFFSILTCACFTFMAVSANSINSVSNIESAANQGALFGIFLTLGIIIAYKTLQHGIYTFDDIVHTRRSMRDIETLREQYGYELMESTISYGFPIFAIDKTGNTKMIVVGHSDYKNTELQVDELTPVADKNNFVNSMSEEKRIHDLFRTVPVDNEETAQEEKFVKRNFMGVVK